MITNYKSNIKKLENEAENIYSTKCAPSRSQHCYNCCETERQTSCHMLGDISDHTIESTLGEGRRKLVCFCKRVLSSNPTRESHTMWSRQIAVANRRVSSDRSTDLETSVQAVVGQVESNEQELHPAGKWSLGVALLAKEQFLEHAKNFHYSSIIEDDLQKLIHTGRSLTAASAWSRSVGEYSFWWRSKISLCRFTAPFNLNCDSSDHTILLTSWLSLANISSMISRNWALGHVAHDMGEGSVDA